MVHTAQPGSGQINRNLAGEAPLTERAASIQCHSEEQRTLAWNLPDERCYGIDPHQNPPCLRAKHGQTSFPTPIQRGDSHGRKADCLEMIRNHGLARNGTVLGMPYAAKFLFFCFTKSSASGGCLRFPCPEASGTGHRPGRPAGQTGECP